MCSYRQVILPALVVGAECKLRKNKGLQRYAQIIAPQPFAGLSQFGQNKPVQS
jgi:hypothetical protein